MFLTRLKSALKLVLAFVIIGARAGAFAQNLRGDFGDHRTPTEIAAMSTRPIEPVTDPTESVARIAGRIRDNYAHLHTVRAILQTTSVDRSVTKREEVTIQEPNGARVHYVREPSAVWRVRLLLSGEDLYREGMDEDGEIWSFQRRSLYAICSKVEDGLAPIARTDARHLSPRPQEYRIDGAPLELRRSIAIRPCA